MIEGPRGTRSEEREPLRQLVGNVFRPSLMDEYPQLFHDGNLENCRIILEDGKIVSHVGLTQQWASILGCTVGVGCIGGVGTDKAHRGKGYATQLFDDASAKCYAEGFDFMIISGDRSLYRRAGCRKVGRGYEATIAVEQAERFDAGVSIVSCTEADIPTLSAIYRAEPVRFLRPREVYERALDCCVVMNRFSGFWLIKKGDAVRGYAIVSKPSDRDTTVRIAEYAGERTTILGAFAQIGKAYHRQNVALHILGVDGLMRDLLSECGIALKPSHSAGTVQIVNSPQLMARMRPYFEEILGAAEASRLHFTAEEGAYQIRYDADSLTIPERGELAHLIFGTREEMVADHLAGEGKVAELMRRVLPIPALWYGINYV
ncbi:GNAT family N-acetyltransferase [Candidatus Poribacteria bacterium]|nr:GNAT family N-acetyltransferase [Candidatus Poribacteria bacterium]